MRNIIITGGTRGIGAACVSKFAAAGDNVAFLYKSSDKEAHILKFPKYIADKSRCNKRRRC